MSAKRRRRTTCAPRIPGSPARRPAAQANQTAAPTAWLAAVLLSAGLISAPVLCGGFANPHRSPLEAAPGLYGFAHVIGVPLLLACSAGAWLASSTLQRDRRAQTVTAAYVFALAAMLGWATLSLVRSRDVDMSFNSLAGLYASAVIGIVAATSCLRRNGVAPVCLAVIAGASLVSGLGLDEYRSHWQVFDVTHRVFATFVNPDFLGGYLLVTLPISMGAFCAARERWLQYALGAAGALQGACLLLTGSRASVAAAGAAIVTWIVLAVWAGAFRRRWTRAGFIVALVAVSSLVALAPIQSRVHGNVSGSAAAPVVNAAASPPTRPSGPAASPAATPDAAEATGHSLAFRRWTWAGAARMALANPALGVGIGTFEVAYPRYAITAYTAHAHNSYLQWADETGLPGLALLLAVIAIVATSGISALKRGRLAPTAPTADSSAVFDDAAWLLTGLIAALVGTMLHSLIDSDWAIVATQSTAAAIVGAIAGLSADPSAARQAMAPRARQAGLLLGGLAAAFVAWRAGAVGYARWQEQTGAQAVTHGQLADAVEAFRNASTADALDPEAHLALAQLYAANREPVRARAELLTAVRDAPIGKTYYRLGHDFVASGDLGSAIAAFSAARNIEPHNLQVLRALADTLLAGHRPGDARSVYQTMASLQDTPYGRVRAVPTLVETGFAYGWAGMADIDSQAGDRARAAGEYARAATVLREYWASRVLETAHLIPPATRADLKQFYLHVLMEWRACITHGASSSNALAADLAAEAARVRDGSP